MSSKVVLGFVGAALVAAPAAAQVTDIDALDAGPSDLSTILTSSAFVDLDLSTTGIAGLSGTNNNVFEVNFDAFGAGIVKGTLRATVYGNSATPGGALTEIGILYEFIGDGVTPLQSFQMGLNGSRDLDPKIADASATDHFSVSSLISAAQADPEIEFANNGLVPDNNSFFFDFTSDFLSANDTYAWFVKTDGASKVNIVNTLVTDGTTVVVPTLAFVDDPNTPELGTPTPGAAALFTIGGLAAARRRRN